MKQFYLQILCITLLLAGYSSSYAGSKNKLSDIFIENRGQVKTEKGLPANDVLFYKGGPLQLYITTTGFSAMVKKNGSQTTTYNKIDFNFAKVNIRKDQVLFVQGKNAAINIYGPGTHSLLGLESSKTVLIKDIYPGIDWLWTIDSKGVVSHDFMVNIGADASLIQYSVHGAGVDNSGGDILKYNNQNFGLREGPVVFKTHDKDLPGKISVKGNDVSFSITGDLKKGGFTIDPPLQLDWSHGLDTITATSFRSIATDDTLNTFAVGYSGDYFLPTFPQVNGSYVQPAPSHATQDAFIAKSDSGQNLMWVTFFGGSGVDQANAVAVSPTGIFVTGYSESWDFPQALLSTSYNHPVSLSGRDAFITKFTGVGILEWSTGYGGVKTDEALDIQYYNGNIYVGGYTSSPDFPTLASNGAYFYQDPTLTKTDAFLLEFDTIGEPVWATCFGGSGNDYISSLSVDASGIYTTGYSDSVTGASIPLMANGNSYYQPTFQNTEAFITHFTSPGVLDWSTYFGGAGNDVASCIVHSGCELLICGKTSGAGLPVLSQNNGNYYQPNYAGGIADGFIAGFDPNSYQQIYGTYYGSAGNDALTKFKSDVDCNTVFTGFTNGNLPVTGDTSVYFVQNNLKGIAYDGIMLGMDGGQNVFWSTYFGSTGDDFGLDVAIIGLPIVDMVGTDFYNYGNDTIGGTYLSTGVVHLPRPDVTSNGVSNRFNQLGGGDDASHGDGGGAGCSALLQFQALIPYRNACPNQCNGAAYIDTSNVGGCHPVSILWSNGSTSLFDSTLCPTYWNQITDANNVHKTLYGKFNVLNVPAVPPIRTHCGSVPDWYSYIHPTGGGPPYTIDLRGVSTDSCPNTAYFNISDTAGCTVSFSLTWYETNANVNSLMSIDTNTCNMIINTTFGGNCPDFIGSQSWYYHVTKANGDTFNFPFANYGHNVVVPLDLDTLPGGYYSAVLNMSDCQSTTNTLLWYPKPKFNFQFVEPCLGAGNATVIFYPDTALLAITHGYTIIGHLLGGPYESTQTSVNLYHTITVSADSVQIWQINPFDNNSYYSFTAIIGQAITEGHCASSIEYISTVSMSGHINDSLLGNCGDSGVIFVSGVVNTSTYPAQLSYYWAFNGSTDSSLLVTQPGVYTCVVTDLNSPNCPITLTDTVKPSIHDSLAENQAPCASSLFSVATAYPSGGVPPFTYQWSDGEIHQTAQFLPQGTNWVIVHGANGCTDTTTFQNTKQPQLAITDSVVNPSCYNSSNGSIKLTPTNGYQPYAVHWSSGLVSGFYPTGLVGGSYHCTVTDYLNCSATATITVVQPDSITFRLTNITNAGCTSANGGVQVNANGGTGLLSIAWSDEGSGFTRNDLLAGTYTFTITDINHCQKAGSVHINSVQTLSGNAYYYDAQCYGTASGSGFVTIYQASQPVTYQWSYPTGPGPDSQNVANLYPGNYSVTVTDNAGCSFSSSFTVGQPDTLATLYTIVPSSCNGYNGSVQFITTGGTPNYNLSWSGPNSQGDNYVYGISTGYYTFTISDANGCTDTGNVTIYDTTGLQPQLISLNACAGDSSGKAILTITDGYTANYNITWYYYQAPTGQYGTSITHAPVGDYSVEVTDDQGCDTTLYFSIITATTDLSVSVDTGTGISCVGSYEYISVTATGSFGPFIGTGDYQTYGGTQIFPVTDQTGCGVIDTVTITAPTPVVTNIVTTNANCANGNGSVQLHTTGGRGPYRVYYNNQFHPYTSYDTFPFPTGFHYITVYDANNCSYNYGITILTSSPIAAHVTTQNDICYGGNTGSAQATVTVGTQPITYHWSTGDITHNNIQNLIAGTYSVTITAGGGCTYDTIFTITQPATRITVTVDTGLGIKCNGNSDVVNVVASGGTGHFTGTGAHNFNAGTNVVFVQDSIGCVVTSVFTLSQPAPLNAGYYSLSAGCTGSGSIHLTTAGGVKPYTFSFNNQTYTYNDSVVLNNVQAGSYVINVTDFNHCSYLINVSVQSNTGFVASASASNPTCYDSNDGTITITTTGTGPFTVNGNQFQSSFTFFNLGQGFYTYTVSTLGGCSTTVDAAVFAPLPLAAYDSVATPILCNGNQGQVLIKAAGGTQPYVGTGQYAFFAGNYSQTVTDANGCHAIVSIALSQPPPLTGNYDIITPIVCNGEVAAVEISASGGTPSYSGTGGYQFTAGNQQVTISDTNGCSIPFSFTINQPPPLIVQYAINQAPPCSQALGKVTIYASGGQGPYALVGFGNFNDSLVISVTSGSYSYVVSDNLGCTQPVAFTVNQVPNPISDTAFITMAPECYTDSGSVLVNITGGTQPYWLINGIDTSIVYDTISQRLAAGMYNYQVVDSLGCTSGISFYLFPSSSYYADAQAINPPCYGDTGHAIITVHSGWIPFTFDSVVYYDSVIQVSGLTAGTYNYTLTDSIGCPAYTSVTLSQPSRLVVDTSLLISGVTCTGSSNAIVQVTATGGTPQYSYILQSGSVITPEADSVFTSVAPGAYIVIVKDSANCLDTSSFVVPQFVPSHDSIVVDSVHCYDGNGGVIKIYPLPADRNPYTFSLNGGTPQVYNVFYNLPADNYQVIVSDANNCRDTLNLSVGQPDSIDSRVWLNDTLLPRDSIILNNRDYASFRKLSSNPWMVTFTPTTPYTVNSDTLVQVQPRQSLTYTVTIFMDSTEKGCFIQYTGVIDVMELPELPNTITPNGDGINDDWKIDLVKYPNAEVTIFDRWGGIVYTSTDYTNDWGGIDQRNGKKLPDGTYFYLLKVPSQNNAVYKGDINIVDAPR